nr:DALR anticodon-binding domain-containing protein 3 isoform X1 [Osmia lignaria]
MEFQMENTSICIQTLIDNITLYLCGNTSKNVSVIKVNCDNLATNGELYFLPSLKVWKHLLQGTNKCDGKCTTILQHFLHIRGCEMKNRTDEDITKEVLQSLVSSSCNWLIKIQRYVLEKERICLFLHRTPLIANSIKLALTSQCNFGRTLSLNKVFSFKSHQDGESEITTARLNLIQSVTEKIVRLHGGRISDEGSDYRFMFTTKSQGKVEENYEKCVCGVVKNAEKNCKEVMLTWEKYINNKIKELRMLNEHKYFEDEHDIKTDDCFIENVAKATATFELLSVKPSRSVFIGSNSVPNKSTTNTKGAAFILYNTARISAIIKKYNDKRLKGEYPNLPHVYDVDFSLLNQQDEWELVYNFIIGHQEVIKECLKCESVFQTNPQVICIFLSRLCKKFSIYYRTTKILTEGYDHLIPTMIARLYMLHALQIILQNSLALLDIMPVPRM